MQGGMTNEHDGYPIQHDECLPSIFNASCNDSPYSSCVCYSGAGRRFHLRIYKKTQRLGSLETNCKKIQHDLKKSDFPEASRTLKDVHQNYLVTSFAKESAPYLEEQHIPAIERLSQEYEIKMAKRLEHTKITSTIGPILGLMGTLIPLGPALIGLSAGDLGTLAQNLMVAFATTVVGLFASGIGYVLMQIRRRWYWEDMADINYIVNTIEETTWE